ncbi:hypothetical protein XA68_11905 [Ophiocordyceps unilateralis]|uniref:Uncharacterized protein n=1 Tax=Ophiocordyceps unilateralis TaxID=268505 RepID=A0A2A9PEY0_OPHUN|nr:hypothetical protein XA68_11905 [Ophiocordyceps unilateralis]
MIKIPYNRIHARGDVLFAARSGRIHTFSLADGKHISTWRHPDHKSASAQTSSEKADASEPPAKRQRRDDYDDEDNDKDDVDHGNASAGDGDEDAQPGRQVGGTQHGGKGKGKSKRKDGKPKSEGRSLARVPDRAVVTQLTSTLDGRYIVAVSGHDKIIWVFEHDGHGTLTQLSQRTMPKRPSAIAMAMDSQIICADKFGDVYSLPLVPSSEAFSPAPAPVSKSGASAASTLTVHSKRNLEALKMQAKQLELRRLRGGDDNTTTKTAESTPAFELTLLLGHVSMLTSLVLAESDGRRYIVTADRDEHIRVSRYAPQAHVIEAFCLGHTEFVNAMVIPAERGDVLVSGGGDDDLLIWDWKAGRLLSQTSVLPIARNIVPEISKIAVSALHTLSWPSDSGAVTYILAICEGINAVFTWQLTETGELSRPGAIQLAAAPLDLSVVPGSDDAPPRLVVAADPGQSPAKSLQTFYLTVNGGRLAVDSEFDFGDAVLEAGEVDASPAEIRQLLYTVENLRKQTGGGGGENEGSSGVKVEDDKGSATGKV